MGRFVKRNVNGEVLIARVACTLGMHGYVPAGKRKWKIFSRRRGYGKMENAFWDSFASYVLLD
jgi:hypothetical protein